MREIIAPTKMKITPEVFIRSGKNPRLMMELKPVLSHCLLLILAERTDIKIKTMNVGKDINNCFYFQIHFNTSKIEIYIEIVKVINNLRTKLTYANPLIK